MQVNTQCMNQKELPDLEVRIKKTVNQAILKIAGKGIRAYSILEHVGRRSGRVYVTPVTAYPFGDGFVFAPLNGMQQDWCQNVLAAGTCTLKTLRQEYVLEQPELIPTSQALGAYPPLWRFMLKARSRDIPQLLWMYRQS